MTVNQIDAKQRKIAKALKTLVHPSNPLSIDMTLLYRELEQEKSKLIKLKR